MAAGGWAPTPASRSKEKKKNQLAKVAMVGNLLLLYDTPSPTPLPYAHFFGAAYFTEHSMPVMVNGLRRARCPKIQESTGQLVCHGGG
jgi:hypothetical protein